MEKLYYSISETAAILGESVSAVRFWSNNFSKFITPHRTAKGNRQYKQEDIETLKQIKHLLKVEGLTIEGAQKQLKEGKTSVDKTVKAIERLQSVRAQLVDIKKSL